VARDEDIEGQMGKDIYFDLVDHDKVRSFRVQKQTPFNVFKVSPLIILVHLMVWFWLLFIEQIVTEGRLFFSHKVL
jgi:hypothetical protein